MLLLITINSHNDDACSEVIRPCLVGVGSLFLPNTLSFGVPCVFVLLLLPAGKEEGEEEEEEVIRRMQSTGRWSYLYL